MTGDKAFSAKKDVQTSVRAEDPNVIQRRAARPDQSVWVNASAGTGKTKVLTDRVLRLLLPRKGEEPGTPPHRIMCLTFTKAAATEMEVRIHETLREWAIFSDTQLRNALESKLLGEPPEPNQLRAARELFAKVLDSPGGLNIMTIHSFCQSVLGRFPIEANLPPHFKLAEDAQSAALLQQANNTVIGNIQSLTDAQLAQSLSRIASELTEDNFQKLLSKNLLREITQLKKLKEACPTIDGLNTHIAQTLNIDPRDDENRAIADFCIVQNSDLGHIRKILLGGEKSHKAISDKLQIWIEAETDTRISGFWDYTTLLATQAGTPRQFKKLEREHPELTGMIGQEVARINETRNRINAIKNRDTTFALLHVGYAIIEEYERLKSRLALLDYEDLIAKTLELLSGKTSNIANALWVMFKLDGGIDHMLIDEAQDTNPEQWQIIKKITQEYFTGHGQTNIARTVFVVGDEKQSIYSFQRAAPQEFARMQNDYKAKLAQIDDNLHIEDMITSFRSTKSVLRLVDETFAPDIMRSGMGPQKLRHIPFHTRAKQPGHVEIWPIIEAQETEKLKWELPLSISEGKNVQAELASQITTQIKHWLDTGKKLTAYDRPIEPRDILILVRTRSALVNHLVKKLKDAAIPVSGVDRMVLSSALVVQDMLAIARFALLPSDDLSLATILKSPLFGLQDTDLIEIAARRPSGQTVWDALQGHKTYASIIAFCRQLITRAEKESPYVFFSRLLQESCPAHQSSGLQAIFTRLGFDARDPLEEFLNAALSAEKESGTSLQAFVQTIGKSEVEIKRELDSADNAVRIMTVHGAKGLQAPIVFLPDTLSSASRLDKLIWPDKTGLAAPLWCPRKNDHSRIYDAAFEQYSGLMDEESRRLLYVALTRAEEQIYIGAAKKEKAKLDGSWYEALSAAFDRMEDTQTIEDGRRFVYNPATEDAPDKKKDKDVVEKILISDAHWLHTPMPEEERPPRPLTPSRPSESDPAHISPLLASANHRFKRGNIIHALLQTLPDIAEEKREAAAQLHLKSPAHALNTEEQKEIVKEVMAVLTHSDFAPIFGPGSLAEVPITGMLDDKTLISGQIDRLLITDAEILIIDYKTNRPPPKDTKDVPAQYIRQMEAYRRTLEKIYPDRPIRTALLWTYETSLMEL